MNRSEQVIKIYYLFCFCCRIFVNRSLHLENIKFYGFDMDYTLAGEQKDIRVTTKDGTWKGG